MRTPFYKNQLRAVFTLLLMLSSPWLLRAQELPADEPLAMSMQSSDEAVEKQLESVIQQLQQQYQASFLYEKKLVTGQKVKAELNYRQNLEQNLRSVLQNTGLTYEKIDQHTYVILTEEEKAAKVRRLDKQPIQGSSANSNQIAGSKLLASVGNLPLDRKEVEKRITGKVNDGENNAPLPGVNVLVKGQQSAP